MQKNSPSPSAAPVGDSFAFGVALMLIVNMGQRLMGLARNIGFCQFLSDESLGHWAMANSFFVIAYPLSVLGLTGSFGKFVEYYRVRGGLGDYVWRIAMASSLGVVAMIAWMILAPDSFAWLVYRESSTVRLISWTAMTFVALTVYSFAFDVAVSMREVRIVTWMQFIQGAVFLLLGMIGLWATGDWVILLPSYGAACLLGSIPGWWVIAGRHRQALSPEGTLAHRTMWPRIVPFAITLWLTNLLTNSFELCDRYMLLHLCAAGDGPASVGQYYCGRVLPNLVSSLALMLCGILLPYLSADWERRQHLAIQSRIRLMMITASLGFTVFGFLSLVAAPVLFEVVLGQRYSDAHSIMPISMLQCIWSSLGMIVGTYLLCAEKGRYSSLTLFIGLVINVMLNGVLIPRFGLWGAVIATAASTMVTLLMTVWFVHRNGCRIDTASVVLLALPSVLVCGPVATALILYLVLVVIGRTDWILSREDRREIDRLLLPKLDRFRIRLESLWPHDSSSERNLARIE